MKTFSFLVVLILVSTLSMSQNTAMVFDGIDDNVDLGTSAGAGVRTLECWFRLDNPIDENLSNFTALVARDTPNQFEELYLSFFPVGSTPNLPGHLVFGINLQSTNDYLVYSDAAQWEEDRWYHVAGVIDPVNGMSLYVDGVKQTSTDANTSPSESSTFTTRVGSWGNISGRYFAGQIEDLRFSSDAMYSANFTPPCPDLTPTSSTIGLWNFNENGGATAADSSANSYNGSITGATWSIASICETTTVNDPTGVSHAVVVYPNPSTGVFRFQVEPIESQGLSITIYNALGQLVSRETSLPASFEVNLESQQDGVYFYSVSTSTAIVGSGTLVKHQ